MRGETVEFKDRQLEIIEIVKEHQPITSEHIASFLNLTRSAIRSDLSILTMSGVLTAKPKVGYYYIEQDEKEKIKDVFFNVKVSDIMAIPVVVDAKTSIYDTIVAMFLEDCGTVYVTKEGYLQGVVSRKDLLKICIGGNDTNDTPVGIIMTRMPNIIYMTANEPLIDAVEKIIKHQIDGIPVVEERIIDKQSFLKVIGRVSKTSITKHFYDLYK